MMNQDMGKVLIRPPVPFFIGIGKRTSSNLATDAHMIQFFLHAEQAGSNIAKAFPIGQLCKEQAKILIGTRGRLNFLIALLALDTPTKLMKRQVFKKLSEHGISCIHRSFLFVVL